VAGFPAAILAVWLLDAWVVRGTLPRALPVIGLVVLLVNLLAAGATSYPGVFLTACLLVPLALANADASAWKWRLARGGSLAVLLAALVLAVACARTQVSPVLGSAVAVEQANALLKAGRPADAEVALLAAARNDPWSPEPWQLVAELRLQRWIQTQAPQDWEGFSAASAEYARRDPRHHSQFTAQGNWRLAAWRKSGDAAHLAAAIDAYRQAAAWYPNRAVVHAQLAWASHLAGQNDAAAAAAEVARGLDARNPHVEQKLDRQTVYDPVLTTSGTIEAEQRSAEQIVRRLRKGSSPEPSP
jgi:tetratricopeptide (TPR) repeat protein